MEGAIFLFDEENWSAAGCFRRSNESGFKVFIQEVAERSELGLGERIDGSERGSSPFLEINLEVIRTVRSKDIGL